MFALYERQPDMHALLCELRDVSMLTICLSRCQDPPPYFGFPGVSSMFASLTIIVWP